MESSNASSLPEQIAELIQRRRTLKVLGEVANKVELNPGIIEKNNAIVIKAIQIAGWAPFHYDRGADGIAEPWRVHVVWHQDCRRIATEFFNWFDDVKPSNKLPAMLSACGALVLVTWLPQFKTGFDNASTTSEAVTKEKQTTIDEEHLAATSAMVQNLLLLLTAHSMGTYWSSGGQFRTPEMFKRLGIGLKESLLAGVFVEYPETMTEPVQRVPGKQRENRSLAFEWLREVNVTIE